MNTAEKTEISYVGTNMFNLHSTFQKAIVTKNVKANEEGARLAVTLSIKHKQTNMLHYFQCGLSSIQ